MSDLTRRLFALLLFAPACGPSHVPPQEPGDAEVRIAESEPIRPGGQAWGSLEKSEKSLSIAAPSPLGQAPASRPAPAAPSSSFSRFAGQAPPRPPAVPGPVKPGTQGPLNDSARPFAAYLQRMHEHIHPRFADGFLDSIERLPHTDPLWSPLRASVELVLDAQGQIEHLALIQPSGVAAFDEGVLRSIREAAAGFDRPPASIQSFDGRVYVQWEFHRNPDVACSNKNARPVLLKPPAP